MNTDEIVITLMEAGQRAGVRPEAVSDFLRRGLAQFPLDAPMDQVGSWVQGLKTPGAAPHLFSEHPSQTRQASSPIVPEHRGLSPEERLTRYRPKAVPRERPQVIEVTGEQAAALAKLTPTARLTQYRQFQQQQRR
jgi:hypothetical protein